MSSPAFDIDEPPPDLSQRFQRVAALRYILAANIPCALWGKEAFLWHSIPDEWHEAHVLIPDAQLAAAAAALVASGEFTTNRPARRIGVTTFDGESIFPGPCIRLFTTSPPVMRWEGADLPDNTPSIEILLIPASNYSVDLVNEPHLFDAYQFPDEVQTANENSSLSSPPSLLVPKVPTLIAGMAAFLLSNSPHSHCGMSYRYHMWCLGSYQFYSEQWDQFFPAWSPNTEEEALEVRRAALDELGTGTDAHWLYELVIKTRSFPHITEFAKRVESKCAKNEEQIKPEIESQPPCGFKHNTLPPSQMNQIRTVATKAHPRDSLPSSHTPSAAPSSPPGQQSHIQTSTCSRFPCPPVRSARTAFRLFPSTVPGLRKK